MSIKEVVELHPVAQNALEKDELQPWMGKEWGPPVKETAKP